MMLYEVNICAAVQEDFNPHHIKRLSSLLVLQEIDVIYIDGGAILRTTRS